MIQSRLKSKIWRKRLFSSLLHSCLLCHHLSTDQRDTDTSKMRPAQLLLLDKNLWTFSIKVKNGEKIRKRISQLVAKQWTFSFNLTNISDRKIQKIQFGVNNTHLFSPEFKTGTKIVRHFVLFQLRLIIINHIGIWQIGLIGYT